MGEFFCSVWDFLGDNKDNLSSLGSILGLGVIALAYFQYLRSEQWKRVEHVSKLYKRFQSDPVNRQAMLMFDWTERKISFVNLEGNTIYHPYKMSELVGALESKNHYEDIEVHIRDTMDNFFSDLDDFGRAIKVGLAKESEVLPYVQYWLMTLNGENSIQPDEPHLPAEVVPAIREYLMQYSFNDALYLLDRTRSKNAKS